jgi:hypothetical protein
MDENFKFLLGDLRAEYPKQKTSVSSNFGRPMKIELKSGVKFGAVWFRWENQNDIDIQNEILCFNSGNREIDRLKLNFKDIKSVSWD